MAAEPDEPGSDPGRALYERLKAEREAQAAPEPLSQAPPHLAEAASRLPVGTDLNHIYEVRRFIARGGMGEVYEGVNIATDERVAIKIILEHLANDPAVNAIFRKEAHMHTRLNHPALAQYRLATREPQLGVFYIVT